MKRFKYYSVSLLKGLVPLIILLAIGNLWSAPNWRLLINYYLILNFLTFYPYNLELNGFNQKEIKKDKEDETPQSRQEMNTREISTENVTKLLIFVVQFAGLILIAPGQFIYYYLIKN